MNAKERKEGRAKGRIEKTLLISLIIFGGLFIIGVGSASTVAVSAEAPPDLVSYTISNRTITPPQTTSIDVAFSERVKYTIAIEKDAETIYDWSGTATNPAAKVWDGTDEATDETVPVGVYSVSVTGVSTETGLSVINNTETITVSGEGSTLDTITISPSIAEVAVGNTRQFTATAYDQNSNTMSGVAITWTSGNATVGTVSPTTATTGADGTATTTLSALAEGTTTVMASNGAVSASATVNASATEGTDWNPWDDDGIITTAEIQETVSYWLTDTPKNGHLITTEEIQDLVNMWLMS